VYSGACITAAERRPAAGGMGLFRIKMVFFRRVRRMAVHPAGGSTRGRGSGFLSFEYAMSYYPDIASQVRTMVVGRGEFLDAPSVRVYCSGVCPGLSNSTGAGFGNKA